MIGGAEIFKLAWPQMDRLYLTLVHKKFEGDVHFPEFDLKKDFTIIEQETGTSSTGIPYSFITADRI